MGKAYDTARTASLLCEARTAIEYAEGYFDLLKTNDHDHAWVLFCQQISAANAAFDEIDKIIKDAG